MGSSQYALCSVKYRMTSTVVLYQPAPKNQLYKDKCSDDGTPPPLYSRFFETIVLGKIVCEFTVYSVILMLF